ncbi:MAG: pirin family protein [Rhizobiales bacterium]|nr:pirin family protein [Hyphomicrobiales bacterium]
MQKIIHKANSRGTANHGWLHSFHTFSFAGYHNSDRMGFGKLRVLNDDVVQPSGGFATHPHENMEIVSIPLAGSLKHKDSMGNVHVIETGEVQVMSAGTGITHSEYNGSDIDPVNFLQIWILPKEHNVAPRYDQNTFLAEDRQNRFQTVITPDGSDGSLAINQNVFFSLANLSQGKTLEHDLSNAANGVYLFVLKGEIKIDGEELGARDAIGLTGVANILIQATKDAEILSIETPMD